MDHQALILARNTPPIFEVFRPIKSLDAAHYALMSKLCSRFWDGTKSLEVAKMIHAEDLTVFEVEGGLVLLQPIDHPIGRELYLYGIVGEGILKQGEAIVRDMKLLAKWWNCSMLGAEGLAEGWLKAAVNLGFRPVSTRYLMELDDGR